MNELALFAGAGGGILGGHLLGWRTVCAVEREPYAASVLAARQNDGLLPTFPIWDDVCTFDGRPWRGLVDVVSGGFPCQDISAAGSGKGIDGEQSGLWLEMARIVGEVRPRFVFVENSPMLTSRGLGRVLGDLAEMGFDARWGVLGAFHAGYPHGRERIWIVAHTKKIGCEHSVNGENERGEERRLYAPFPASGSHAFSYEQFRQEVCAAEFVRKADGMDARMDRVTALGNGQVPRVAAAAWLLLTHNASLRGAEPSLSAERPSRSES